MNWEAIGALAELLGAIGVIVTLVYLAVQVRQNTRTVRAATELETGRLWSEVHGRVAHSPDMAAIWDRGLTDETALSPAEKQRFIWFVAEYLFLVESLYRQWRMDYLSDASWEPHRRTTIGLLSNPLVRRWWDSGVSPFSGEFRAYFDRVLATETSPAWSYRPLSDL
jgi:hypothetical protein